MSRAFASMARSWSSSCGVLALKKGSMSRPQTRAGGNGTGTVPCRSVQCSTLRTPPRSCSSRSSASATGHRPMTGCSSPCDWASAMAPGGSSTAGMQPRHQIGRQQRRVAGRRHDPARVGRIGRRPAHAGQHAGERADEAVDRVGHDRQPEGRKARGIAVGIDDHGADLGPQPADDVGQHGPAGELEQPLVAAAHAARLAAGEHHARHVRPARSSQHLECLLADRGRSDRSRSHRRRR